MSCEVAAETFCISGRSVQRVLRQFNALETLKQEYRAVVTETEETILLDIVFDNPADIQPISQHWPSLGHCALVLGGNLVVNLSATSSAQ